MTGAESVADSSTEKLSDLTSDATYDGSGSLILSRRGSRSTRASISDEHNQQQHGGPSSSNDNKHQHGELGRRASLRDTVNRHQTTRAARTGTGGTGLLKRALANAPGGRPASHSIPPRSRPGPVSRSRRMMSVSFLVELSDSIRTSLAEYNDLGPDAKKLAGFLDATLTSETTGESRRIDFQSIKVARLDKMLADIIEHGKHAPVLLQEQLEVANKAAGLQRLWRARFKAEYFQIDDIRTIEMAQFGRLKQVSFSGPTQQNPTAQTGWKVDETAICPSTDLEDNDSKFRPGQWWLNIACAYRDGIVGCDRERPTTGRYGVTALPLLTGTEEKLREKDHDIAVRYIRQGTMADMHVSLLSQTGRQMRILRGYQLRSTYAPSAGVRYDGVWKLGNFGIKLDDKLYEKLETEKVRKWSGKAFEFEWKVQKEEDRLEREQWQRMRDFRKSIGGAVRSATPGLQQNLHDLGTAMKVALKRDIKEKVEEGEREAEREAERENRGRKSTGTLGFPSHIFPGLPRKSKTEKMQKSEMGEASGSRKRAVTDAKLDEQFLREEQLVKEQQVLRDLEDLLI
ncbi:hypothetical protein QBC46DRAFT_352414 [Diplogelasinospora grovesii]|uniref:YDG domain-containing protein n=1 Tax=Diplogelasinospora grovesii TaxID=303347 RepID=A0AAN6NAZ8_9PEZI|nr:hypothetical protein QBC46DRAFT_352414 [Diplogelasinospora grovesii]